MTSLLLTVYDLVFTASLVAGWGTTAGGSTCTEAQNGQYAPGGVIGDPATDISTCVVGIGGSSTNAAYVTKPTTAATSSAACQCAPGKVLETIGKSSSTLNLNLARGL